MPEAPTRRATRPATVDGALLVGAFVAIMLVVHGSDFLTVLIAAFCLATLDRWEHR